MKKTARGLLLIVLAALLMVGVEIAFADEAAAATHNSHPICGAECTDGARHNSVSWTAWDGTTALSSSTTQHVYLTQDVTRESTFSIQGKVYLCLNGHTIKTNGKAHGLNVSGSGELILCDCQGSGCIEAITDTSGSDIIKSGIYNAGKTTIYSGSVKGSEYGINNVGTAKTIVLGGSVTGDDAGIYNDSIGDESRIDIEGGMVNGGVRTYSGSFNMLGGQIIGGQNGIVNGSANTYVNTYIRGGTISGYRDYGIKNYTNLYLSGNCSIGSLIAYGAGQISAYYAGASYAGDPIDVIVADGVTGRIISDVQSEEVAAKFKLADGMNNCRLRLDGTSLILERAKYSGACGTKAKWEIYDNGDLIFTGSGQLPAYSGDTSSNGSYTNAPWYAYRAEIKSVTIGSDITSVGNYSFNYAYYNLESVKFCNTGELSLGTAAFSQCEALKEIDFGTGTIVPQDSVFARCTSLETLHIPANVMVEENSYYSGDSMFIKCKGLKDVTIDCAYVGRYMFEECTALETVTFTNKDTDFNFLASSYGAGNPFNPNGASINAKIIAPDCSLAHYITTLDYADTSSKYYCYGLTLSYEQIGNDTSEHSGEWNVEQEATCKEAGSKTMVCDVCGCTATGTIPADPNAHVWDEGQIVTEPDCDSNGTRLYTCTLCEATKQVADVPALGHIYGEATVAPSCTQGGFTLHVCGRCGNTYTDNETAATGHLFGEWVVTESTCTEEGSKTRVCTTCGFTETQGVEKKAHEWSEEYIHDKEPTCTTDGSESIKCEDCGTVIISRVIPATGHQFGEWVETKPATCTEEGSQKHKCTVEGCGYEETMAVPALGHQLDEGFTIDTNPTCTEEGSKSIHCSGCSEKFYVQSIPATGHKYESKVKKAQIGIAGKSWKECSVCHAVTGEKTLAALKPAVTKITSLAAVKKGFTVKWAKKAYTGYQIRYSLKSSMASSKTVTITKAATVSKKITKLKAKKKYYVQVRTYKTVNGKKWYSAWSAKTSIKTK